MVSWCDEAAVGRDYVHCLGFSDTGGTLHNQNVYN